MGLGEWFGFTAGASDSNELPEIFPIQISQTDFIRTDIISIFSKILTDVLERVQGLSDDQVSLMWDSCVKSSSSDGLITLLAKAMADKQELFIVYDQAVNVIRKATSDEQSKIKADYDASAESSIGVYISFANYMRADMVKLYSGLEYCTVSSLSKSMNLSKAVQIKISDLRSSVSLSDADSAKNQAKDIARSLAGGKDVMLDAKDLIETAKVDLTAVQEGIEFIVSKLGFYLGLPAAYLTGEQTTGMGTTGENDTKAIERGLKNYFFSIMKPTLDAIFGVQVKYKSQDFRQIASASDILKTFSLIDGSLVSEDNKRKIVNAILDLPEDAKGDAPDKVISNAQATPIGQVAKPAPRGGVAVGSA